MLLVLDPVLVIFIMAQEVDDEVHALVTRVMSKRRLRGLDWLRMYTLLAGTPGVAVSLRSVDLGGGMSVTW